MIINALITRIFQSQLCFAFRYEMLFKQAVTSEDLFLQVGNRNPSTACCEDLVVSCAVGLEVTLYSL